MFFARRTRNNNILRCLFLLVLANSAQHSEPLNLKPPCKQSMSVHIRNAKLLQNGDLLDMDSKKKEIVYPFGTYWESPEEQGNATVIPYRGCPCLLRHPCIPKCCPQGSVRNRTDCVILGKPLWIDLKDDSGSHPVSVLAEDRFEVFHRDPCKSDLSCNPKTKAFDEGEFYVRPRDGHLVIGNSAYGAEMFCLEYFLEVNDYRPILYVLKSENRCRPNRYVLWKIDGISSMVSVLFPMASLAVYLSTPHMWNLYGRSLACYFCSMMIAFFSEGIAHLGNILLPFPICVSLAYLFMYSSLVSFFWLNVMCFDLTFASSAVGPFHESKEINKFKKFLFYALHAWGSPLMFVLASLIADINPNFAKGAAKPNVGVDLCWFKDIKAETIYYDGPIFIIMFISAIFLIIAGVKMFSTKPSTSNQKNSKIYKQRFFLYVSLFNVMAAYKVVQLICWFYDTDISQCITYFVYAFQGPFIFLAFIWKDKIKNDLLKRFFPKKYGYRVTSFSSYRLEEPEFEAKKISRS